MNALLFVLAKGKKFNVLRYVAVSVSFFFMVQRLGPLTLYCMVCAPTLVDIDTCERVG